MALRGIANQFNTSGSTTVTVNVSLIGIQANDIILLFMNGGGSGTANFTYPSGFTAVPGLSNINLSSGYNTLGIAYKVAGSSEPSSYSVTSDQFDSQSLDCHVYSGRSTSAPFTAVASTASTAATAFPISVSASGVTAAANDDVVLLLGATGNGSAVGETQTLTGPTGFSNQGAGDGQAAFSAPIAYADYTNNPGGATGTLSATWASSNGGNPLAYGAYVISLASSGGGGSVPYLPFTQKLVFVNDVNIQF